MKASTLFLFVACLLPAFASVNYTYDAAGRLAKVDYGNGTTIVCGDDKAGNLLVHSVNPQVGVK